MITLRMMMMSSGPAPEPETRQFTVDSIAVIASAPDPYYAATVLSEQDVELVEGAERLVGTFTTSHPWTVLYCQAESLDADTDDTIYSDMALAVRSSSSSAIASENESDQAAFLDGSGVIHKAYGIMSSRLTYDRDTGEYALYVTWRSPNTCAYPEDMAVLGLEVSETSEPSGDSYAVGDEIVLTVTVTNLGVCALSNIVITDSFGYSQSFEPMYPGDVLDFETNAYVTSADVAEGSITYTVQASADNDTTDDDVRIEFDPYIISLS